jgi:EF-hand domain
MSGTRTFNIDDEQRTMIASAFQSFDHNRDGYLDYFEVRAAAASVGFELAKDDIKHLLETSGELRPYGPPSTRPPQLAKLMLSETKFADAVSFGQRGQGGGQGALTAADGGADRAKGSQGRRHSRVQGD